MANLLAVKENHVLENGRYIEQNEAVKEQHINSMATNLKGRHKSANLHTLTVISSNIERTDSTFWLCVCNRSFT